MKPDQECALVFKICQPFHISYLVERQRLPLEPLGSFDKVGGHLARGVLRTFLSNLKDFLYLPFNYHHSCTSRTCKTEYCSSVLQYSASSSLQTLLDVLLKPFLMVSACTPLVGVLLETSTFAVRYVVHYRTENVSPNSLHAPHALPECPFGGALSVQDEQNPTTLSTKDLRVGGLLCRR